MIRTHGLKKSYQLGEERICVLHGVNLEICQGEMVALTGWTGLMRANTSWPVKM
jgi:ABC-type lipoprotein export system ATPase subunit